MDRKLEAHTGILVVGGGQAGAQLALRLRDKGFDGRIVIAGEEDALPYERPPLSKAYLGGRIDRSATEIRDAAFWRQAGIELALGRRVDRLDTGARQARFEDGSLIRYDWCVLATGTRVRELDCPGAGGVRVLHLRTLADAEQIRAHLTAARRIAIVGAGYIGLEVAASARSAGHEVTVIEAQDRVLARVAGPLISAFYLRQHRARGVRFRLGESVLAIEDASRRPVLALRSGERIEADLVIVGIGVLAETAVAERSGIACDNGVLVDESFRTGAANVLAIGDCARHPNRFADAMCRLESVQHALDSADVAADTILGDARGYDDVPWFWSDQYDLKLQTAGLARAGDDAVARGGGTEAPFTVAYLRGGRLVALDAVNNPRDFMAARKLIRTGISPDPALLADPSVPLKSLA